MANQTAVIIDAVRTAGGKRHGRLSGWHPVDLAAEVLGAIATRTDLDPAVVDEVIMGCATQVGDQAVNVGRNAVLAAGWPESVAATSVDRQCASSLEAIHFAAQGVMAGAYDVVVAAGVECMSTTPVGASTTPGSMPFGPRVMERYAPLGGLVPQGISAELVAERWDLSREELDAFAVRSHQRAERATVERRFDPEILPVQSRVRDRETGSLAVLGEPLTVDESVRPGLTAEVLATLKPAFQSDGRITAGNSAPVGDGAAAVLIMSATRAAQLGLRVRARFAAFAVAGVDPLTSLTGPIPATVKALQRAKLGIGDIDVFEVNESFAAAVLAWHRELQPDLSRVNPNGGAIALGHPLGCSGARLMTALVHELERTGARWGLQTMGASGGTANATIIERIG
jgi:acetyl-CoA acyltransferase